jgi:anti-sigma regulatory factor (Ser/Thr protein kinase)
LTDEGLLIATGKTKGRRYQLRNIVDERFYLNVAENQQEDVVWREKVLPLLDGVKKNVLDICQYGFTEIYNNVIDHSASDFSTIVIKRNATQVILEVIDMGVGIWNKLQSELNLLDPRHALLELSKGKLTTDEEKHTGEGIFFTSRMFDKFSIASSTLVYSKERIGDDWLIEVDELPAMEGTGVFMEIHTTTDLMPADVFKEFASEHHDYGFTRTHVPLKLLRYEGEELVSRSQARRLLARLEGFMEVLLDFQGITTIGQAFADEIFRVYRNEHPNTEIIAVRMTPDVVEIIDRVAKAPEKA